MHSSPPSVSGTMTRIPNGGGVSLEEDRFEVECWRYVGDPVGYGSKSSGRPPRAGMLDLGKSVAASSSEKSEGWFGVSVSYSFLMRRRSLWT